LSILPSGPIPASSFELLASTRMTDLIHELERQADLVIVAASPLLLFADSLVLASRVDGVVVVAHSGVTRRATLVEIVESLHTHGATTLGMILDQNQSQRPTMNVKPKTASRKTVSDALPVQKPVQKVERVLK
jgi:Mrp family chromosome partitioning ATPase